MKLYCAHEIPLSAGAFWEILHAPEYERAVAETIGLQEYRELDRREDADAIYRKIRVEADLPSAVHAILKRLGVGEKASYLEEQWRQRDSMQVRWKMTPAVLADRTAIDGVVRVEPKGRARCRRVLEGRIDFRVFGVGGVLERAAVSMVTDAYAKGAEVAGRFA